MATLVVLPTHNERLNVVELTDAILDLDSANDVCVVDDASPDGTADCVREAAAARPRWREHVFLIVRDRKEGRGGAVREGFAWGMARGRYDAFVEMDCDFSHQPAAIPQGVALLEQGYDVVIGSRYPDGTVIDFPASRRLLSLLANKLARLLIDRSIADYTTGFRFYRLDYASAMALGVVMVVSILAVMAMRALGERSSAVPAPEPAARG